MNVLQGHLKKNSDTFRKNLFVYLFFENTNSGVTKQWVKGYDSGQDRLPLSYKQYQPRLPT